MSICLTNYDEYMQYLGKIASIINESTTSCLAVVGDSNAKRGSPFKKELIAFVNTNDMFVSDFEHLGHTTDVYTYMYVSDAHSTIMYSH